MRLELEHLEERAVPTVSFASAISSPTGADRPQLIAVGSFRSGPIKFPDLVVTTATGFTALFGDGKGHFGNPINTTIPNTDNPEGIVAGDFENNGTTDVAVATYGGAHPGAVTIFRYSLGQFTAIQGLPLLPGAGPTYLATADLNHDGKLDLLVADFNNNAVLVFLGNGDGTFAGQQVLTGNGIVNPNQIVAADFNSDGILDLAVANKGNGSVSIFKGNGDGTFTAATNVSLQTTDGRTGADVGSVGLAAGDLNGDGKIDLAVANYGTDAQGAHTLNLLLNNGQGGNISFASPLNLNAGDHLINVAIADLGGDGKMDLAVSSSGNTDDPNAPADNRVIVFTNLKFEGTKLTVNITTLTAGANPVGLVAQDVTGDGLPELLSANQNSGDISTFLNQSTPPAPPAPPAGGPSALHAQGTQLVDASGNPVVLRGVNIAGLESYPTGDVNDQGNPTILQSVDVAINDWHANLIRLTVYPDFWFGHDEGVGLGEVDPAAYRSLVDQVIAKASADNAYVMLAAWGSDMGNPGAAPALHDLPDTTTLSFWQDAAARYANDSAVLFDPFNEPHDVSWDQWLNGSTNGRPQINENGILYDSPGMQGLLNAIRGTGANNVVAPEGLGYGSDLSGVNQGYALNDPAGNLMYQFHLYPAEDSGADGTPSIATRDARVDAVAGQYPIYVGEWGTYSDDSTNPDKQNVGAGWPDAATWTQNMLAWLDQHRYSWTAWDLNPNSGPDLISDWNYTPTTYFGTYVMTDLIANSGGNGVIGNPNPGSGMAARTTVANDLTHSGEYYSNFVTAAYEKYLGRAPEASGLSYWVSRMQNGLSDERLEAGFIGSQEYIQNHGGTGDAWVRGLYKDLLGRDPQAAEVTYWVNNLKSGMSAADVAYGFAASAEREGQRVAADYNQYLGRSASSDEVAYWVKVFLGGADNEKVVAGFISSQESFAKDGGDINNWLFDAYTDVLNRTPDAAGRAFFLSQLQ